MAVASSIPSYIVYAREVHHFLSHTHNATMLRPPAGLKKTMTMIGGVLKR